MEEEQIRNQPTEQEHFAADEDVEDLIAKIEAAGTIRNDIGKEYPAAQVTESIYWLLDNVNAGKYDHDTNNQLLHGDLITITSARGIRRAVEDSVAHTILRRQLQNR